jgi:hypothetical protein
MEKPKIYLETTRFSLYHEERTAPQHLGHKALVRRIFDLIKAGEYEPFTSTYADEERRLAALYVQEKAISPAYTTDAAHIAITAVNGLDFIVSLNFTHIARPWTMRY